MTISTDLAVEPGAEVTADVTAADVTADVAAADVAARRRRGGRRLWVLRGMAVAAAAAAIAWHLAGAARPASVPGAPVLRTVEAGGPLPVLVVPNRPGPNLVHVAATDVSVGADRGRLVPAAARPGASGGWAVVDLPPGRTRLWVGRGGHVTELALDTGRPAAGGAARFTGEDGPECASAVLGRLTAQVAGAARAAGAADAAASCPADALTSTDEVALRGVVRFLAGRDQRRVTLAEDGSPRSAAAAGVVREEAARAGVTVGPPGDSGGDGGPLLVVSGWTGADAALRALAGAHAGGGAYLAPWLLHAPLLGGPVARLVALDFAPTGQRPQEYVAALGGAFPGEPASTSGYRSWLAAGGGDGPEPPGGPIRLYAAARLAVPGSVGHAHTGSGWLPEGRLTAVTAALNGGP